MQLPEELRSPRLWSIVFGVFGSAFAAASVKDATPMQRAIMLAAGAFAAGLFGPPIVALVNAPEGWGGAISFLIGWVGWALMGKLVSTIKEADLWGLVRDIIRSWFQRG